MSTEVALAHDTLSSDDLKALCEWIPSAKRLTKGELTNQFELEFAERLGSKYAVFLNSGSSANLIAASALLYDGKLRNKIVVVPAVSWVTTVTPFIQLGFDVKVCDCDPSTLGLNLKHLKKLFEEYNPSVLILVHVLGHNSSIEQVQELCTQFDVRLIEDSCEAIGSTFNGKSLGTFGDFGTYSFYYGHQISTIEGGMLVTDNFELAQVAKSLRAHGWSRDLDPFIRERLEKENAISDFQSLYTFYYPGYNCRPTDVNAFLGLRQIKILSEIVKKRSENFSLYASLLPHFWCQSSKVEHLSSFSYGTYVENRVELARTLASYGVESRPLICGSIARQPFMKNFVSCQSLPHSDRVHDFGIYFPNHFNLTQEDIEKVCTLVVKYGRPIG